MIVPSVRFDHLAALTTADGLHEHAEFAIPRPENGYCVDDAARALVVTSRQFDPSVQVRMLTEIYLRFVVDAITSDGRAHNRRVAGGPWLDSPTTDDHWGRALWGLGTAAAHCPEPSMAAQALAAGLVAARGRSVHVRAMAHAAVGAYELLSVDPGNPVALALMADARDVIGRPSSSASWPWPEARLLYANALLPEALILCGRALEDPVALADGLALLDWLVGQECRGTHLSVTPTHGRGPGDPTPGFDQQPIEVSSLAEACARALDVTGDPRWAYVIDRCTAWFLGWNDSGKSLYDPLSGGGRDGLLDSDVNLNQGAESTISAISVFQLAGLVAKAAPAQARVR